MKQQLSHIPGPIGVFDSGYGGLTILEKIREVLPEYDYIYLGDNARAPYGTRSFEIVYEFTLQAVNKLFEMGCHLVILACNTASAKALRSIQMNDLPELDPRPSRTGSDSSHSRMYRRYYTEPACRHTGNIRYHQIRILSIGDT